MKRILVLTALSLFLTPAVLRAEDVVWCIITDRGDVCAMSDVACLAAADDDSTFSVVLNSGTTLQGVRKASFGKRKPLPLPASDTPLGVHNVLSLTGVETNTPVCVYDLQGRLMMQATAATVDVHTLSQGTYIMKVNARSFRFQKR